MSTVAIEKCKDYSKENVENALIKTMESLGGIGRYVKPGMKVAIKPNLVMKKNPRDAATTHPSVIKALCRLVADAGGIATIVDSPGGIYTEGILKGIYSVCGMAEAAKETGARLNFDLGLSEVANPHGKLLKRVMILKPLAEADIVINVAKLKTHGQMVYSGAVKNMFGAIAGVAKAEYHLRMPDYDEFANALIDIFLSVKPALNIMDAVVGMEGYGPTAGNPKEIGLIMASEDAFSLDRMALRIIGIAPQNVPVIKNAMERGLCPEGMKELETLGVGIGEAGVKDFEIPQLDALRAIQFYDRGVMKLLLKALRPKPVFNHAACIGCSECAKCCPAGIIQMKDKRPSVDLSQCIRCFCCQELCPAKAVEIRRPFLSKFLIKKSKKI